MLRAIYLRDRFFYCGGALVLVLALGFALPLLFAVGQVLVLVLMAAVVVEALLLFQPQQHLQCQRVLPANLGMGDDNRIALHCYNPGATALEVEVIEELPVQLQQRDFLRKATLAPQDTTVIEYTIHPVTRGEFWFGATNLFVRGRWGLLQRRIQTNREPQLAQVLPSVDQMKQIELQTFERFTQAGGKRRIRRLGHSYEFEHIKEYVAGDDIRSINWKASGRRGNLMVNKYEDERAQPIYCLIDKSRVMRLPFAGMTLMDYAINAALALSNVVLRKHDKAGLITFSDKIGATIKADSRPTQLAMLLHALYNEQERPVEANYDLLYYIGRKLILGRSLLLLFTNFESTFALERVLPTLRRLNHQHLLVVIFFENTEIRDFAEQAPQDVSGIYFQAVARKFLNEKVQMVHKLRQYGIQALLTRPEELSLATVNKYLELKARGLV